MRDGPFSSDLGIVNLHPLQGSPGYYISMKAILSWYGIRAHQKVSDVIIKRNGFWFSSEYKEQGVTSERDSYCAAYCLYIPFLTKVLGKDFI